jgi:hypothetical protein
MHLHLTARRAPPCATAFVLITGALSCMFSHPQIFPRPLLDAALDARRAEREEGTREVREQMRRRGSHTDGGAAASVATAAGPRQQRGNTSAGQLRRRVDATVAGAASAAAPTAIPIALFPAEPEEAAEAWRAPSMPPTTRRGSGAGAGGAPRSAAARQLPPQAQPYLSVPPQLTVGTVRAWLIEQLLAQQRAYSSGGGGSTSNGSGSGSGLWDHGTRGVGQEPPHVSRQGSRGRGSSKQHVEQPSRQEQQQLAQDPQQRRKQKQAQAQQQQAAAQEGQQQAPSAGGVNGCLHFTSAELERSLQLLCRGQPLIDMGEGAARLQQRLAAQAADGAPPVRASGKWKGARSTGAADPARQPLDPVVVLTYRLVP